MINAGGCREKLSSVREAGIRSCFGLPSYLLFGFMPEGVRQAVKNQVADKADRGNKRRARTDYKNSEKYIHIFTPLKQFVLNLEVERIILDRRSRVKGQE
jgi:hypothetical protein